jgi:hypothetical protein
MSSFTSQHHHEPISYIQEQNLPGAKRNIHPAKEKELWYVPPIMQYILLCMTLFARMSEMCHTHVIIFMSNIGFHHSA